MGQNHYFASKTQAMKFNEGVAFNGIFWLLYFLYQWLGLASLYGDYNGYFINACLALPVSLLFSVLAVHVFFMRFYHQNKKLLFWLCVVISSCLLLLIRRYFNYYLIYPRYFPAALNLPLFSAGKFLVEFVNLYAISGLYALYYFIRSWHAEKHRVQELLQQKTLAELDLLKAQVQPHFVFNALNNIYSTALKTSPETATLIEHLSGFLAYNLYDASRDKVPLSSEFAYIHHYMELQKHRYGSRLTASLHIVDDISRYLVAPLLLLPLVENSFKHGVGNAVGDSWVKIEVSTKPGAVVIRIENNREEENTATTKSGIGLSNVRKRLQLIYPGRHELQIIEEVNAYLVNLTIQIETNDEVFDS